MDLRQHHYIHCLSGREASFLGKVPVSRNAFSSYLKEPKEALGQPVLEFAILNLERGANITDFKNLG